MATGEGSPRGEEELPPARESAVRMGTQIRWEVGSYWVLPASAQRDGAELLVGGSANDGIHGADSSET